MQSSVAVTNSLTINGIPHRPLLDAIHCGSNEDDGLLWLLVDITVTRGGQKIEPLKIKTFRVHFLNKSWADEEKAAYRYEDFAFISAEELVVISINALDGPVRELHDTTITQRPDGNGWDLVFRNIPFKTLNNTFNSMLGSVMDAVIYRSEKS